MPRFLSSALCLAVVLGTATSAPSLRSRYLQSNTTSDSSSNSTMPSSSNSTSNSTMPSSSNSSSNSTSNLPACRDWFPAGPPLNASDAGVNSSKFFEARKASAPYKNKVVAIAPCLLQEGNCHDSLEKVNVLTGALASVTQQLYNQSAMNATMTSNNSTSGSSSNTTANNSTTAANSTANNSTTTANNSTSPTPGAENNSTSASKQEQSGNTTASSAEKNSTMSNNSTTSSTSSSNNGTTSESGSGNSSAKVDPNHFASIVANSSELRTVVEKYGGCINSQPNGVDTFLQKYSQEIKSMLTKGSIANATTPSSNGTQAANNSSSNSSTSSPSARRKAWGFFSFFK